MLANVPRPGRDFGGLSRYLTEGKKGNKTRPERVLWTATRNLLTDDITLASKIMTATARQSVRVERPVYHGILSWAEAEQPSREDMEAVIERTLDEMGLAEHQVIIVAHGDTENPHLHFIANRVHPETGTAWSASHDYARLEQSVRAQAKEMGFIAVPGRHTGNGARREKTRAPSKGQVHAARKGDLPLWSREQTKAVAKELAPHFAEAASWEELSNQLKASGAVLKAKGQGLIVTDRRGIGYAKLSGLGEGYRMKSLEARFGETFKDYASRSQRSSPELVSAHVFAVSGVDIALGLYRLGLTNCEAVEAAVADRDAKLAKAPLHTREVWACRPVPAYAQKSPPTMMPVKLGEALNAGAFGGTASVHRILTSPYHFMAAKVFNAAGLAHRRAPDSYTKLHFIAANSEALKRGYVRAGRVAPGMPFVAWPEALLYEANAAKPEHLIGFAMPLFADAHPLSHLTSPKQRKTHFPGLGAEGLLTAAKNIAKAVQALHGPDASSGMLIGDLTPRNVLITSGLDCLLIDADSYQFTMSSGVFRTADTTPGFRSPQMAKAVRDGTDLPPVTPADDAFCLAVVLFHVLVDGAHPWTAGERFEINGVKPDEEDNMLAKRFPYAEPAICFPPKIRLQTYQKLPLSIRQLFEAAFLTPKRPPPQRWIEVLNGALADMFARAPAATSARPRVAAAASP